MKRHAQHILDDNHILINGRLVVQSVNVFLRNIGINCTHFVMASVRTGRNTVL